MEPKRRTPNAGELQLVLSPKRRAAARARRAVRRRFSGLPAPVLDDLITVVSELVNNSVQHGPGKPITLSLVLGEESIRGEVADQGNPAASIPRIRQGSERDSAGLDLVDKLTSEWAAYDGSTHVWFELPLDG